MCSPSVLVGVCLLFMLLGSDGYFLKYQLPVEVEQIVQLIDSHGCRNCAKAIRKMHCHQKGNLSSVQQKCINRR